MLFFLDTGGGGGENSAKPVLCKVETERDTRADVETFDTVNLIFPWGAPPPYVFPPISAAVSAENSGLSNRSPTAVLKYIQRAGSFLPLRPTLVEDFSPNLKSIFL